MEILNNIKNLFLSSRFISFYWRTGGMALAGLLDLVLQGIDSVGLPVWAVALIGLAIGEATKAINNLVQSKDMGFSQK